MCYGTCYFEEYMGECNSTLVYERDEIVNEVGFNPCFIGGAVHSEEEEEYFKWLDDIGAIKIVRNKIYDYLERRRKERMIHED